MREVIAFRLDDGPFAGHQNLYEWDDWPPPEEIIAFTALGNVAVAPVEKEEAARETFDDVTRYRKVAQSQLPEPIPHVARGAVYEVIREG